MNERLRALCADDLQPYLNQEFQLSGGGTDAQPLHLELVEVTLLTAATHDEAQRQPFSLLFNQPEGSYLPQGIYQVAHPAFGALALFLVPLGPGRKGGMRYQAIFN